MQGDCCHQSERRGGKTTTTVNLGVGLAQQGKKVLLVDTEPQGSLTVSLGVKDPDDLDTTISDLMQSVVETYHDPEEVNRRAMQQMQEENQLQEELSLENQAETQREPVSAWNL